MDKMLNFEEIEKGVFVINKKYEIVYMDEMAKQTFPNCGYHSVCHSEMRDSGVPCFDCPLNRTGRDGSRSELIYNRKLDIWMEHIAIPVEWPQEGSCTLISMRAASPDKTSSAMHADQNMISDAFIEFQLSKDRYSFLYCNEKQMPSLAQSGSLQELLHTMETQWVYKEDLGYFKNFWNPSTLAERIAVYGHVSSSFRILLHDEYRWMKFYITASSNETLSDTCICLIDNTIKDLQKPCSNDADQELHYDELTNLYQKATFERLVRERLRTDTTVQYGLVDLDIEHFKLFNDWYGMQEGDNLLMYIAYQIRKKVQDFNGIATRIGGDEFVMLLPQAACDVKKLEPEIIGWIQNYDATIKFLPTVGIYMIQERDIPIAQMCDRAAIAAGSRKGNYASRVAVYQESMKKQIEDRQEVLFGVKSGLDNNEFVVYYQPQVSARTSRILGAEALVRWQHPQRGLLAPGEFIPILEASGFIYKLDSYVWEEVCRFLHERITKQLPVVPISVNVSRVDMFQFHLCDVFTNLIKKYEIPAHMLEIEITESAYVENFEQLIETVSELRSCGFTVLMDDFGSGYSSLNMLSNIELDILKIDMKFLETPNNQMAKNSSILESITSMGRWLGLRMIAEGVETHDQVDRLLNLDCEYMQGYYFYKPMSQEKFCEILSDEERVDSRGMLAKRLPSIDLDDLFHKDITSEAMLSNILGGIALYEIEDDHHLRILMVNDRYYRITGCNAVDLQERSSFIVRQIYPDDLPVVWDIFHKAEAGGSMGASGTFRRYRLSGELMWMRLQAFFLHRQGNRKLFYGSVSDVSATMSLQKELLAILQTMPGDIFEYQVSSNQPPICRVVSAGLTSIHGYSLEELHKAVETGMLDYIDSRDHDEVMRVWSHPELWGNDYSFEFRLRTKHHEIAWVEQHIRYIREEDGVRIYNSLLTDITKIKNQEDEMMESQRLLHHLLGISDLDDSPRQLTKKNRDYAAMLYASSFPGGMIGGYCEEGFPLYFANEEMIRFLGYDSYHSLYQGIDGRVENTIYEGDRKQVACDIGSSFKEGMEYATRYRMVRKDGSLVWVHDRGCVVREAQGRLAIISSCMDIDEIMNARQELQDAREDQSFLNKNVPGGYHQIYDTESCLFRHVSERFLSVLGIDEGCLQHQFHNSMLELVHKEDRALFIETLAYARVHGVCSGKFRMLSSQGIFWVSFQGRYIHKDRERYISAIILDIDDMINMQQKTNAIIENTPGDVISFNNEKIIYHSYNLAPVLGYTIAEYQDILAKESGNQLLDARDQKYVVTTIRAAEMQQQDIDIMFRVIAKDCSLRVIHMKATYCDAGGIYHGILIDASDWKQQEQELAVSNKSIHSIIRQANLDVWEYDLKTDTLYISREGCYQINSRPQESSVDQDSVIQQFHTVLMQEDLFEPMAYHILTTLREHMKKEQMVSILDLSVYLHKEKWIRITSEKISNAQGVRVKVIGYFQEITEEKKRDDLLQKETYHAQFDSLTGVYNRRMGTILIENKMQEEIPMLRALCMFDLDDFKQINDTFGHIRGDHVLQKIAHTVQAHLDDADILCRQGGDEFLIYTCVNSRAELEKNMNELLQVVSNLRFTDCGDTQISISMGIALQTDKQLFADLYAGVDRALYRAKKAGKGVLRFEE